MGDHWQRWHEEYDTPGTVLAQRLAAVQTRLRDAVASCPPGPIRLVAACAGQARDVLGLAGHPRVPDISGRLVELDPVNAAAARDALHAVGLTGLDVVEADAGWSDAYAGAAPADVVMLCGVFGNVSIDDVATTIAYTPRLCAPAASVLWTRNRKAPDVTPRIRELFAEEGFGEMVFDAPEHTTFGVGLHQLVRDPLPYVPGVRLFTFLTGH